MYGLPAYNEIDPTIFVAITYSLIFGAMFGDAGQGLCLLIGGFLLYKFKKIDLAAIISCAGFFSTISAFASAKGSSVRVGASFVAASRSIFILITPPFHTLS